MRKVFTFVLFAAAVCNAQGVVLPFGSRGGAGGGGGTEIRRASADSDPGAVAFGVCTGTNQASNAMPTAYDGSGESTSSPMVPAPGTTTTSKYRARVFTAWVAASGAYSSLNLKIYSACTVGQGANAGAGCSLEYSVDNGGSWVAAQNDISGAGWSNATPFSAVLSAAQNLTLVRVRACAVTRGDSVEPSSAVLDIYDIRTEGVL